MANKKRLIDANALLRKTANYSGYVDAYVILGLINHADTVDAVEVVHGDWQFGELDWPGASVKCSNCGWGVENADPILWLDYPGHRFCGACGAKMDGGE